MRTTAVVLLSTAVFIAISGFLGASDTLPSNIHVALTPVERQSQFDLVGCILAPPTGAARGMQIVLLCLLFGGVPSATLAVLLRRARATAWPPSCVNLFLAGFVFQLSSLAFTSFLLILLLSVASSSAGDRLQLVLIGEALV